MMAFVMNRLAIALAFYFLTVSAWAIEPNPAQLERVIAALQTLDNNNLDEGWQFTMTVVQKEETQVIRSHPTLAPADRRQLISVNDSAPDSKRLEEFREAEKKRIDEEDPNAKGFAQLVDAESLVLTATDDTVIHYTFAPVVKALENARDKLAGKLLLNRETGEIEELEIFNTEKISPAFSVTLESYKLKLKFGEAQGHHLLHAMESHALGKAGFVKAFDEKVNIEFSDFVSLADNISSH